MSEKISVDDNDGLIRYSGPWSGMTSNGAYQNTLHLATNAGASASFSFTGISVNIIGTVPPCTTSGAPVTFQISMNTEFPQSYSLACTSQTQNGVLFYSSGTVSNGPHTITLINGGSSIPLLLDLFLYATESTPPSPGTVAGGASTTVVSRVLASTSAPGGSSLSAGTASSSSGSSLSAGTAFSSSGLSTASFGSPTSVSRESDLASGTANSRLGMGASTVMILTTIDGVATSLTVITTPTSTADGASNSRHPSPIPSGGSGTRSHLIGPIVGCIIAAIVVFLVLFLLRRRRKQTSRTNGLIPVTNSPKTVTPYNLAPRQRQQTELSANIRSSLNDPQSSTGLQSPFPSSPNEKNQLPEAVPSSSSPEAALADLSLVHEKPAHGPSQSCTPGSYANPPPQSPPPLSSPPRHSIPFSLRPPSSITPSEAVPAYVRDVGDPNARSTDIRHRSGLSNITQALPPSYDDIATGNNTRS